VDPEFPADVAAATLTPNALTVLERRYLERDGEGRVIETPDGMFRRVARAVASVEGADAAAWEERFYRRMARLEFLPNSPTLMNAGRDLGQLAACFVVPVGDSMPQIFDAVKWASMIQMTGGGTGFSFSQLRPAGDLVASTRGVASGPMAFMDVFNSATDAVKQGGTRRGANMGVLRVDHPDVMAFVEAKLDPRRLTNFNVSLAVTDAFMRAVEEGGDYALVNPRTGRETGRLAARLVWRRMAEAAWRSGDPGVIFIDRVNELQPTPALGAIESTNPCVAGDTRVLVEDAGWIPIRELVGGAPRVATADSQGRMQFHSAAQVVCTGVRPVYRLRTREGCEVRLTRDHRVATARGDVPAGDLVPGDRIVVPAAPVPDVPRDGHDARFGEVVGWLTGDGHFTHHGGGRATAVLSFYGADKAQAAPRLLDAVRELIGDPGLGLGAVEPRDLAYVRSQRLHAELARRGVDPSCKQRVPEVVARGSLAVVAGYLRALFSADGSVQGQVDSGASVRLAANGLELLRDVQLLLQRLGIASVIYANRRVEGVRLLPDADGVPREYRCASQHELAVARSGLRGYGACVGFLVANKQRRLDEILAAYCRGPYAERGHATFEELVLEGEEEVFDLSEPRTHHFVADGLLVHNCGEQPLLPFESCVLGSIDLGRFVAGEGEDATPDWQGLAACVHDAVRFLDDVIDVTRYPLPQIEAITRQNRKIGLGVMGFADLLVRLGVAYDDPRALEIAHRVGEHIERESIAASAALARERGAFAAYPQSRWPERGVPPLRNATTTTVAPTGTISIIAGCSSGIEPIYSIVYDRHVLEGAILREVHPLFADAARAGGFGDDALWAALAASGRARGTAGVPAEVQRIFATAHDLPPEVHVRMQAVWQQHCHAAVSKTVNFPFEATPDDVMRVYQLAYDLGCKGVTVYRDRSRATQVLGAVGRPAAAEPAPPTVPGVAPEGDP
jgi:ribonucleoside-diphosphate reductase alpha chain